MGTSDESERMGRKKTNAPHTMGIAQSRSSTSSASASALKARRRNDRCRRKKNQNEGRQALEQASRPSAQGQGAREQGEPREPPAERAVVPRRGQTRRRGPPQLGHVVPILSRCVEGGEESERAADSRA